MKKRAIGYLVALSLMTIALDIPVFAADSAEGDKQMAAVFDRSLKGQLPMTPDQIDEFKQRMQSTKRALHKRKPPKMINRTRRLSFDTGQESPVIRIAPGYVTTISFFDCTGQPWPVTSVVIGNPNFYSVAKPQSQTNVITISALKEYVDSNLALTFQDHHMPATIQLKTVASDEEGETDSLVVFRAEQRGPNAEIPMIGPEPEPTIDSVLMSFLDNVPPDAATRIQLLSGDGKGKEQDWRDMESIVLWSYMDSLYLRTTHPLTWPAWNAVAKGPGNVMVYELSRVPSLMISRNGGSVAYEVGGSFYE